VWLFTDDDLDTPVTEVPQRELSVYLSEHSGRADCVNAIFAAEAEAAWKRYTNNGRQFSSELAGDIEAAISDRSAALEAETDT